MTGFSAADVRDRTGQTAIVTGASSGIGMETAKALIAHGARDAASGALPTLYAATADLPGNAFAGPSGLGGLRGAPAPCPRSGAASDAEVPPPLAGLGISHRRERRNGELIPALRGRIAQTIQLCPA
jgi:hypothetical protein